MRLHQSTRNSLVVLYLRRLCCHEGIVFALSIAASVRPVSRLPSRAAADVGFFNGGGACTEVTRIEAPQAPTGLG